MADHWSDDRIAKAKNAVCAAGDVSDMELLRLAGFEPRHFRYGDWRGMQFERMLAHHDFTGADLSGCRFEQAQLHLPVFEASDGVTRNGPFARFEHAILGRVIHDPDRDPTLPGLVTPIANLRAAEDWDAYRRAWTRPERWPDDGHLPIGAIFQDAPFAPEMVVVPPGRYLRGSPEGEGHKDERLQREVTIDYRFAVGRFPVTFEEWDFAVEADVVEHKPEDSGWGRGRRPVMNVPWNHIVERYLPWLNERLGLPAGSGYRLLTEAEWEYCCRAGTKTAYSFGDALTKEQAQFSEGNVGSAGQTVEVGSFPANAFGLHDMHGNVWEWCQDAWHDSYDGAPDDGSAWESAESGVSRVLRGGSWSDDPRGLRSAYRGWDQPVDRGRLSGFRLARTLNL